MLIISPRSRAQYGLDIALTLLGWATFAYLLVIGTLAVLALDAQPYTDTPGTTGLLAYWLAVYAQARPTLLPEHLLATVATMLGYAVLALASVLLLIGWAKYNQYRYTGKDRRKPVAPLSREQLRASFGISVAQFADVQNARVMVIGHDDGGNILDINVIGSHA